MAEGIGMAELHKLQVGSFMAWGCAGLAIDILAWVKFGFWAAVLCVASGLCAAKGSDAIMAWDASQKRKKPPAD